MKFLTSNPEEGDISTALDHILEDWQQPVCTGMRIMMIHPRVSVPGRETGHDNMHSYVDLGDLPAGRTVWVCGKLSGKPLDQKLMGLFGSGGMEMRVEPAMIEGSYLKSLYGASALLGLEFLIHSRYAGNDLKAQLKRLGYNPEEVLYKNKKSSLYPENNEVNEMEALRNFIVEESLNYGIPSSETAFIAVYNKAGKRVEATVLVPNALPEGWSEQFETSVQCSMAAPAPMTRPPAGMAMNSMNNARRAKKSVVKMFGISKDEIINYQDNFELQEPEYRADEIAAYSGVPITTNGEAVVYDSSGRSDGATFIRKLKVKFPNGAPAILDKGLKLLIFVNDPVVPRASVSLADLVLMGGVRPLNVSVDAGASIKIVLVDPNGAWATKAPKMEVRIELN